MGRLNRVRQLQTTACQPHCGTLASNTRKIFQADATPQFLLATRTLCTASCAKFLGDETCHTSTVLRVLFVRSISACKCMYSHYVIDAVKEMKRVVEGFEVLVYDNVI